MAGIPVTELKEILCSGCKHAKVEHSIAPWLRDCDRGRCKCLEWWSDEVCGECKGSGKCSRCSGTGQCLWSPAFDDDDDYYTVCDCTAGTCKSCKGSGRPS